MAFKPADWDFWNKIPKAELWQCVLLSLGIEPRGESFSSIEAKANANKQAEIIDRLFIAQQNIGYNRHDPLAPLHPGQNRPPLEMDFNIPHFVAWAKSLPWQIPPELTGYGPPKGWKSVVHELAGGEQSPVTPNTSPSQTATQDEKPLTNKERENLRRIIGVLMEVIRGENGFVKHRNYESDAELIRVIEDKYALLSGLKRRNLEDVFKLSKQSLKS